MSANSPRPEDGPADQGPPHEPLHELTLGRRAPSPDEAGPAPRSTSSEFGADADLDVIEARSRLKAEAARRAAGNQCRIRGETGSHAEIDPEIAGWAERLTDCFYWLETPDGSTPDPGLLDDVGGCFEAVATASSLVAREGRRGSIERSLPLLAEAQSALRRALQRLRAPDDPDQLAAYEWVRVAAARHHVFLLRHMRADDLADPDGWPDLLARIEARSGGDRPPQIERVRRHLEALREGQGTDEDWEAVIDDVDEMVGSGVPPSDREIRDLLLPVLDDLPDRDDLPPGFRLVLREIDRYLATRPSSSEETVPHEPTAEVKEARRLLGGRVVVLIGGTCRPAAQESLRASLGLEALTWVETKEHQSIEAFEPIIARPEVTLVLLAIRWSSHGFGEVRRYCDRHGKPLVRLPGGYGPNQVAAQILAQCGDRLGGG